MVQPSADEAEIFGIALGIASPPERIAYLREACGTDAALRARVLALLQVAENEQSFLEAPPAAYACTIVHSRVSESPGTVIGPYKLLEQIGEGGFGVVFMAEQTAPVKRKVALKVIKPGMDTRQVIARFEAERQALALMDHPHIAKVLDAGATDSGRPYFVMELVKGVPITEYCDQHQVAPRERLELFITVCQAVQHAHQKGIIHRDIKPSNVLVSLHDDKPVVKVIDFGIAKATSVQLTDKTLFTGFAQLVGTPLYMSPEQAALNAIDVDTRSDVYSLGVLLYELLTGTTPFDKLRLQAAAFDEVRRIIREEEPQKPSTRLSSSELLPSVAAKRHLEPAKLTKLVRGDLDWIVMKALEKDRARRYETANGFAADVLHYLADEPVAACPPSAVYRFRKFARRNRRALATASIVAIGLVAAVIGLSVSNVLISNERNAKDDALADKVQALGQKDAALKEANQARSAETAAKNEALALRDGAIADAYRAQLGETRALREARLPGWRETALRNLQQLAALETPVRDLVELRSEAAACLGELDVRETDRFEGHMHLVYGLDFSPDGSKLATAGYDGKLFLWKLGERRPVLQLTDDAATSDGLWGNGAPLPVVRFRPDGRCLAVSTWSQQVRFEGLNEALSVPDAIGSDSQPRDIAFDREGKLMAVSWGSGQVGIYDALTGELKRTIETHAPQIGFYMRVALSPDGDRLAARGPGETIQLFDLNSEAQPTVLGSHGGLIRGLAFSSDGRFLASASEDRTARVWELGGRRSVMTLQGHSGKVISVAFSPNDELVATGSDDGSLRLWETQTGQPLMIVPRATPGFGAMQGVQAVAFSPDGQRIAAASQKVVVFEIAPRRLRRLPGHGFLTSAVAFHPDKPILAASSRDRDLMLWDVEQGRAIERIPDLNGMAGRLAFHPDGSLLVAAPYTRVPISFGGGALSANVCVLEPGSSGLPANLPGPMSSAVAFDPSGRRLAMGDRQGRVWMWDVASGKLDRRCTVTDGWITDIAFIDNGSRLVVGDVGGLVVLWDLEHDQAIRQARLPGGLLRLEIESHQHWLAAADFMGETRLLSLPDLKVRGRLDRIEEPGVVGLAFRQNSDWLAAGGADRRVTIWDTRTFEKSFQLPLLNSPILDLACQADGSRLAVATADELIPIWDVEGLRSDLLSLGLLSDARLDIPIAELAPETSRNVERITPPPLVTPEWAIWLLERLLEVDPEQPQICVTLAWMYVMGPRALRDPEAALPLALRAVELAPQEADCLNTLGVVYYRLGRWHEAIETLQASIRANPQGATGYDLMFLGMSYQQFGQEDLAREQFDLAARWWAEAQLSAGQMSEWNVIRDEAERLRRGEAETSATAAEQLAQGQTYVRMNVWTIAARHFSRASQLAPDDPEPWFERGRCHAHLQEWPGAVSCFAKAVERQPDNVQYWYEHAIAFAAAEDLEGYRRTCAAMVDRFGDTADPGIAGKILYVCLPVQDAGVPADELVRLAHIAAPWFQGNVRVVAAALYRNGEYEAALQRFAEFHAVGAPKAWDWLFEAMLAQRLNRRDEARQYLDRATAWIEQADQFGYGQSEDRWVDWFERVEVGLLLSETQSQLSGSEQKSPTDTETLPLKTTLN